MSLPVEEMKGRRLGRVLTKLGKVSRDQVHEALEIQKTKRELIGRILIELGYVTEEDVLEARAGQAGLRFIHLKDLEIDSEILEALPAETANTFQVVPIEYEPQGKRLTIAMKDPDNFQAIDDLRLLMGFKVAAVVAPPEEVDEVLKAKFSTGQRTMADIYADIGESSAVAAVSGRGDSIDLDEPRGCGRRQQGHPAAQPGAAAGDPRQGLGHPLRAVRGRVQDALPHRRRPLRDGPAAEAPRAGDRQPHQGHGEPRHRRAAPAAGRPHRAARSAATRSTFASRCCRRCSARASSCVCSTARNVQLDLDRVGLRDDELETMPAI